MAPQRWEVVYFESYAHLCLALPAMTLKDVPIHTHMQKYPDGLVPSFKPVVAELYERCTEVSHKILEVMGYALKIEVRYTHF